jgi:sugar phosphate permease
VLLAATLLLFGQGASILDQAWLVKELGFETGDAQRRFGGLFLIGSLAGALLGGPLADLFVRRSPAGRLYYAIAIYAFVVPVSVILRVMEPSAAFYIGFLIVSAGVTLHYASLLPTVQELAPLHARATIIAVTLLVMALIGSALGNLAAGMLADLYIARGLERPVTWAIISINLVSLLALPALYMAARNYSRDREAHGSLD